MPEYVEDDHAEDDNTIPDDRAEAKAIAVAWAESVATNEMQKDRMIAELSKLYDGKNPAYVGGKHTNSEVIIAMVNNGVSPVIEKKKFMGRNVTLQKLGGYEVSKVEYDFAMHLLAQKNPQPDTQNWTTLTEESGMIDKMGQSQGVDVELRSNTIISNRQTNQEPVPVTEITGYEIEGKTISESRVSAKKYINELISQLILESGINSVKNNRTGFDVLLKEKSITHGFVHHGFPTIKAVAGIKSLIETAAKIATKPHDPETPDCRLVHTFVAPISISGSVFAVKLTVKEKSNGEFVLYDHQALELAQPVGIYEPHSSSALNAEKLGYHPATGMSISIEQLLTAFNGKNEKYIEKQQENATTPDDNRFADTGYIAGSRKEMAQAQHDLDKQLAIADIMIAEYGYLPAPNGEKSNLNRLQWAQVRTPQFKEFYGDWKKNGLILGTGSVASDKSGTNWRGIISGSKTLAPANTRATRGVGSRNGGNGGGFTDGNGEPVVFYHGTSDDVVAFDTNHKNRKDKGWLGRGVYVTDAHQLSSMYAKQKQGDAERNVMPLFVGVRSPLIADIGLKKELKFASQEVVDGFTAKAVNAGYDCVVIQFANGVNELVAFNPNAVKSAIGNRGTFGKGSHNILDSVQQKVADKEKMLQLMRLINRMDYEAFDRLFATIKQNNVLDSLIDLVDGDSNQDDLIDLSLDTELEEEPKLEVMGW